MRGEQHGGSRTRLYRIWVGMKSRCYGPHNTGRQHYGDSGVTVCDEWRQSFAAFRDWAIANGYADGLWLDRRESSGPYEPNNCRWSTPLQQKRNIRKKKAAATSQYKGVWFSTQAQKFQSRIRIGNGQIKYLGSFANERDAALAYDAAARQYHGDFACCNFPEEV